MSNYYDDDFSFQPKFKDGVKQKGGGGSCSSKRDPIKRKKGISNNTKEIYNSKYIRVMEQKKEKSEEKRVVGNQ